MISLQTSQLSFEFQVFSYWGPTVTSSIYTIYSPVEVDMFLGVTSLLGGVRVLSSEV